MPIHSSIAARWRWLPIVAVSLWSFAQSVSPLFGQSLDDRDRPPINYATTPGKDPVALLDKQLASGEVTLTRDPRHGYLPALLEQLGIPPSSQLLVFSQTSMQRRFISPETPRAVYYNDDVYVARVVGSDLLEISAVDPQQGAIFYTLDQSTEQQPRAVRDDNRCLICHTSSKAEDVPGHLMRSVYPDKQGIPQYGSGTYTIDHSSPLKHRFGGWYVTGTHGDQVHMGNVTVQDRQRVEKIDTLAGGNVTDLSKLFDTRQYLTPHSDIVSHLVLDHQVRMHNLITRANYEARLATHHDGVMNRVLQRPADYRSDSTERRLHTAARRLVEYLLFTDEAALTAPIAGTTDFAKEFAALGPRDTQGRSLRDFDLDTRLFRYPCSFLIYSQSFDQLPTTMLAEVYSQLWQVLSGENQEAAFERLAKEDRQAILEILRDTKPGLPKYYGGRLPANESLTRPDAKPAKPKE